MPINLRSNKIRKIPNLVEFHSLYQLLHSLVYPNGLNTAQKLKETADLVTFTEEIVDEKLHF